MEDPLFKRIHIGRVHSNAEYLQWICLLNTHYLAV